MKFRFINTDEKNSDNLINFGNSCISSSIPVLNLDVSKLILFLYMDILMLFTIIISEHESPHTLINYFIVSILVGFEYVLFFF